MFLERTGVSSDYRATKALYEKSILLDSEIEILAVLPTILQNYGSLKTDIEIFESMEEATKDIETENTIYEKESFINCYSFSIKLFKFSGFTEL